MKIGRRTFLFASATAVACNRHRATAFPGYAFVANAGGKSVAAVDLTRFAVVQQIRLGSAPSTVLAHRQRHAVYTLTPDNGTIYEIDAAGLSIKRKLAIGGAAASMRFAPDGSALWLLARPAPSLVRVALEPLRVVSRVRLPASAGGFDLSRDGLLATASFPDKQSVGLVDLQRNEVVRVSAAGPDPHAVIFRSDGRQILAANRSERMLTILDVKTGHTLVRLPLPVEPENCCVKPDGGQVFITGSGMDAVVVVHPYQTEVAETVLAGSAPGAMAIYATPEYEYLFAANPNTGSVTVLEVYSREVIAAVTVGQEPCYITFTPDQQYALVVNHRSGDLAVIRIRSIARAREQSRSKTAPLFTMIPVGSDPVSAAAVAV